MFSWLIMKVLGFTSGWNFLRKSQSQTWGGLRDRHKKEFKTFLIEPEMEKNPNEWPN